MVSVALGNTSIFTITDTEEVAWTTLHDPASFQALSPISFHIFAKNFFQKNEGPISCIKRCIWGDAPSEALSRKSKDDGRLELNGVSTDVPKSAIMPAVDTPLKDA